MTTKATPPGETFEHRYWTETETKQYRKIAELSADVKRLQAALLKEGVSHGVLSESQTMLVDRAMALQGLTVRGEMTPWGRVASVGSDWPRSRVDAALRKSVFTRMPVVDRRGRVLGRIEALDAWLDPEAAVTSLMKPVLTVSPTTPVVVAIRSLREAGKRLAIVEEDDRPIGIVVMKDLVEPLTGEIRAW